ncbi:RlpA-like double-psi beta-barrel-protein domain-containing protein-containing protein [Mycotypha africana]|uniref:RlpA-like double-psi beta-barrel-protein domain-containing protein-containing protein n=1 Tax=Mycotypha africana TaxID=64632 RepID=UPI0023013F4D|nr:RlpA-like double-psi beta-barrel-protein domain-containing protein-containing protein [Mycotypha africana]KAI8990832.1 RlpA-like double-psi beta-barrel-protein domain-containing protein-containing protein [Mycotypha africana]
MKFLTFSAIGALAVASAQASTATPKRGFATAMDFSNSTFSSLERRDRATWYNGADLKHAACYGRKGLPKYSAHEDDMVGAMAMKGYEQCYKCMKITNEKHKNRHIVVKIVDQCAGCKRNKHIDLTPRAFKKLADLNDGIVEISWKEVDCPHGVGPKAGKA